MSASEFAPSSEASGREPRARRTGSGRRAWTSRKRLALVAILFVGLAYATMIQSFSWNQTSHYDLTRSLNVERTNIDAFQENTGDKVFYKGHWYSARAPGLALFVLPFYDGLKGARRRKMGAQIRSAARRRRDGLPDRPVGQRAARPAAAAARVARRRALRARLRRRRGGLAGARHDGAAALDAAVLARLHGVSRLRRVRADAARARRAAGAFAAGDRRTGDGLRGRRRVPAVLRRRRARPLPALAARRAESAARADARRRLHRRRRRRHRAAAALQPLRVSLLDAPRLLRRAAPAERLLRDRRAEPEGARDAAVRLARPVDDLAGADHGRDRHGAALQTRSSAPRR